MLPDGFADYFWLCLSAVLAGATNALAGGGTLLTFPTLISVLTPRLGDAAGVWANGTSTVALTPASVASGWGFRRELYHLRRLLVWLLPPSLIGGAIGTFLVTLLPPEYFNRLVPWLILTAATLFTLQPLLARRKPAVAGEQHDLSDEFTHIRPLAGRNGGTAVSDRDLWRLLWRRNRHSDAQRPGPDGFLRISTR